VWMIPRETHSVKESVGGSWRKSRYYRTDASGRDRDGRRELWLNFFVDFVMNMMRYFVKKRRE
jgi:hypothetical protein